MRYSGVPPNEANAMKMLLPAAALMALTACSSTEQKVADRWDGWASACGYQTDVGQIVPAHDIERFEACVMAHENAYQDDRAIATARGSVLLGYGATMMATPPAPARSFTCNTRRNGFQDTTTCY